MSEEIDKQVLYLGRWVSREHFRAFVYNSSGEKMANSYQEFSELISSGSWFAEKKDVPKKDEDDGEEKEANNVVAIKPKRGRKCQNLNKA